MHWKVRYGLVAGTAFVALCVFTFHGIMNAPGHDDPKMAHPPWAHEYLVNTLTLDNAKAVPTGYAYNADAADHSRGRANATLFMLARNSDLDGAVKSIKSLEHRWNHAFGYPWVFLNDVPFTEEFKSGVKKATAAPVHFGLIPSEDWQQPKWINETKAAEARTRMKEQHKMIPYADSVSYRNMCRWNSGFFYKHELLLKYKWYWRVEPDVQYHCNMNWDPFWYMIDHKKTYGFVMSMKELPETIRTLWGTVREFYTSHPKYVAKDNSMQFISKNNGNWYNGCHFWSNFEIADLDFFRSKAYEEYFEYLDNSGGFYYERWGDAPVHSIAASLFLPKQAIHHFERIGYTHMPFSRCPRNPEYRQDAECDCNIRDSIDNEPFSCTMRWWQVNWPKGVKWDVGRQGGWEL